MAGNKTEEYEHENYYLLWCLDKWHFPHNCLGLSNEDNSVSQTDNFVNVNFFTVLHLLMYSLAIAFCTIS